MGEEINMKLGSLFDSSIEWRPIKGYENEYLVSEAGDVWSVRSERKLSLKRERTGYLRVNLSVDGVSKSFSVHRLVAMAFIPNPSNKPTVNHINENKVDNRVENLEWATMKEQNIHGTRTQRAMANTDWAARTAKMDYKEIAKKHNYKAMNESQKRKVVQKDADGKQIAVFDSIGGAARSVNVSTGHIWQCCNGQRKTCKGSVWNYA